MPEEDGGAGAEPASASEPASRSPDLDDPSAIRHALDAAAPHAIRYLLAKRSGQPLGAAALAGLSEALAHVSRAFRRLGDFGLVFDSKRFRLVLQLLPHVMESCYGMNATGTRADVDREEWRLLVECMGLMRDLAVLVESGAYPEILVPLQHRFLSMGSLYILSRDFSGVRDVCKLVTDEDREDRRSAANRLKLVRHVEALVDHERCLLVLMFKLQLALHHDSGASLALTRGFTAQLLSSHVLENAADALLAGLRLR
jgi:hypothetical protein